jgi:hypothetical protein
VLRLLRPSSPGARPGFRPPGGPGFRDRPSPPGPWHMRGFGPWLSCGAVARAGVVGAEGSEGGAEVGEVRLRWSGPSRIMK